MATIEWVVFLLASILVSILGVLIPNRLKEDRSPRSHNTMKLIHECLARHQLAYFTYFLALTIAVDFELAWLTGSVLTLLIIVAVTFYVEGVRLSTRQDDKILQHHTCENPQCTVALPFRRSLKIMWVNGLFTVALLASGIFLAFQVK